jgi:3-hydroxyisobutyrate dehydrogenase-like beta-hydroxyacid dehydrogenase
MKIGFLGYGEAARAFHEGLARPGLAFLAYDILLDQNDKAMADAMEARGARVARDVAALAEADWIFSAVTADQSFLAIEPLLPHLRHGQVVVDINSVSPARKKATSDAVEAAGATYLDMAVMAPVHPRKHRTPVLIAGEAAERIGADLTLLGFSLSISGTEPGRATAVKMVRSLFVKGLEAITVETLLAAEASGCFEEILASLSGSFPGLGWPSFAEYQFERTSTHGRRRAAEMMESAVTLDDLGLNGGLARAVAEVQEATGSAGGARGDSLRQKVREMLSRRLAL